MTDEAGGHVAVTRRRRTVSTSSTYARARSSASPERNTTSNAADDGQLSGRDETR
jgi:hypothetical protein